MILNVSGRCDIVAFFTKWFINRYREGYIDVRNPFYPKQVSRILMSDVDAIVFCTKNPLPILPYLKEIEKPILFHVTLTPYRRDIEPNVFDKKQIIKGIRQLSEILGRENVYVRYDPILFNKDYSISYHIKAFDKICNLLDGYISHIIISFVDEYKNVRRHSMTLGIQEFKKEDYQRIGFSFSKIAKEHGMTVQTCFEEENLVEYGFLKRDCIDANLAFRLTGKTNFKKWKARGCGCVEMVDIGVYNCCHHFCKYCYANYDEKQVLKNIKDHDVNSSLLIGHLTDDDVLLQRRN